MVEFQFALVRMTPWPAVEHVEQVSTSGTRADALGQAPPSITTGSRELTRSRAGSAAAVPTHNGHERADTRGIAVGTLSASIGYMLRRAQLAVFADFGATLAEMQLRPGQFAALMLIGCNRGVTQSEVCESLGIWRANFVAVIDDLERRGLARRVSSSADRRSKALALTAAGRRLLERATDLQRVHETRVCRRLGPGGREELLRLLDQLAADH